VKNAQGRVVDRNQSRNICPEGQRDLATAMVRRDKDRVKRLIQSAQFLRRKESPREVPRSCRTRKDTFALLARCRGHGLEAEFGADKALDNAEILPIRLPPLPDQLGKESWPQSHVGVEVGFCALG